MQSRSWLSVTPNILGCRVLHPIASGWCSEFSRWSLKNRRRNTRKGNCFANLTRYHSCLLTKWSKSLNNRILVYLADGQKCRNPVDFSQCLLGRHAYTLYSTCSCSPSMYSKGGRESKQNNLNLSRNLCEASLKWRTQLVSSYRNLKIQTKKLYLILYNIQGGSGK